MTFAGWIFMLVSLVLVWCLAGYCYVRVLRSDAPREWSDDPFGDNDGEGV